MPDRIIIPTRLIVPGDRRILPNFTADEFWCKCGCHALNLDPETAMHLQYFRTDIHPAIVNIHSACRCVPWNRHEGGEEDSYHICTIEHPTQAFDFDVKELRAGKWIMWSAEYTMQMLDKFDTTKFFRGRGICKFKGWIHVDSRKTAMETWNY